MPPGRVLAGHEHVGGNKMPTSILDREVQEAFDHARDTPGPLFPSPEDWRDQLIYFLMLDRFNRPDGPPRHLPFDDQFNEFQGGTFNGVREQLPYLKELGVGALWLSPVLKNPSFDSNAYHGYGIQNFLAVEPRFASRPQNAEAELEQLIRAAHDLGIYVILDIVLHHAGNVFEYVFPDGGGGIRQLSDAEWQDREVGIRWRDPFGHGDPAATTAPTNPPLDAAVWPTELRRNEYFTRRGNAMSRGFHPPGDFNSLKGIAVDFEENGLKPVHNILIRAHQYIIARFDVDGFRIDTLKFIPSEFERIFGNAMREFALSVGKKNFFTFGEVFDNEQTIAQFIGRNTHATGEVVGVDAALDYPLFFQLPDVVKGLNGRAPADIAGVYEQRKQVEQEILTSHGEAGKFFVTFLDNHDQSQRFGFTGDFQGTHQITLGLACLFCLQGIPCLYYGTEQGLRGHKPRPQDDDSFVREALWGKSNPFDPNHPIYQTLKAILRVRSEQPALRYGRQYFRPLSGDGRNFGLSPFSGGVMAVSRILNDEEVIAVANTNTGQGFTGEVIVDRELNPPGARFKVLFSNRIGSGGDAQPGPVVDKPQGSVTIREVDGSVTDGFARALPVQLAPMEIQILGRVAE
jgi:glycosidase